MLSNRAGFTLGEVIVALVLTSIIGAAVTGVFISQSQFFDTQEKVGFARGVSRSATNIMLSEMRMIEQVGGVEDASASHVTLRVPYALGVVCRASGGVVTVSRFPTDGSMLADSGYSGYAYRGADGAYTYVAGGTFPSAGTASHCSAESITTFDSIGGAVEQLSMPGVGTPAVGDPVLFYQRITYEFKASNAVPGRIGLFRRIEARNRDEELVAPFDDTAGFRFYVVGSNAPQASFADESDITGLELRLDGLSERPASDGTYQSVPHVTSVFFKNQ